MTVTELALLRLPSSLLVSDDNNDNKNDKPDNTITLLDPLHSLPPELQSDLLHAQHILSTFSTHRFTFYRCIEDASLMFILGSWESVVFHRTVFLPSEENQGLLETLVKKWGLGVDWMFHVDVDGERRDELEEFFAGGNRSGTGNGVEGENESKGEGVIAITRCGMSRTNRTEFTNTFESVVHYLVKFVGDGKRVRWGFRLDEKDSINFDPDAGASEQKEEEKPEQQQQRGTDETVPGDQTPSSTSVNATDEKEEFVLFSAWESIDAHMAFARSERFAEFSKIRDFVDLGIDLKHGVRMVLE